MKNLEAKNRRRTISKREYYLGLKELSQCLASTETLEKSSVEARDNFLAQYNTDIDNYTVVNINMIFNEVQTIYQATSKQSFSEKLNEQDDVKKLKLQIDTLEKKTT